MKTLGSISANLIAKLYDTNKRIFTIKDVITICKNSYSESTDLIFGLVKRKIVFRLKRGKYIIIPQELGSTEKYIGNWYVATREIVNSQNYYVGFYAAMHYWGMTTQPTTKIYIVTDKRQFSPNALSDIFIFVYVNKKITFGIKDEWVTKTEKVKISDIERTIVDVLAHPEYSGGITEIAKGIWLVKDKINFELLVKYVKKYDKNVVAKRLGYLLEILNIGDSNILKHLKKYIKARYDVFDPTVEKKNINKNNWRLIDNIGKQQIRKIISY